MAKMTEIQLVEALKQELQVYAADGFDTSGAFVANEQRHLYAALAIFDQDYPVRPRMRASVIVLARVEGEYIIIEEDRTDRPLVDALTQNAGVPESQIICAYAGEKVPSVSAQNSP